MKTIVLTQGKRACVDDDVFEWASRFRWYARKSKGTFYVLRHVSRKGRTGERDKKAYLHREILGLSDPAVEVNHIDGDGLNNCRENLAAVSKLQNHQAFRRKAMGVTSHFRGVCWESHTGRWKAQIGVGYRCENLGRFDSEEEAARVRDQAALRYFGPIAQLNFPV
jgi:hypothetical protein